MQRRQMLAAVPVLAATAATTPSKLMGRSGYQPIGYVNAYGPALDYVKSVTVDGVEVPNCVEANDIEGWASGHSPRMFDKPFPQGVEWREYSELEPDDPKFEGKEPPRRATLLMCRYEGDVRIHLKDAVTK